MEGRMKEMNGACQSDVQQFCKDVNPGGGRLARACNNMSLNFLEPAKPSAPRLARCVGWNGEIFSPASDTPDRDRSLARLVNEVPTGLCHD
jgi:hypothetical protein